MGVPKFYRWISERYPCLSEVVKEFQIPAFDNLYLDMNGIIHPCSHPNDEDPHFRISEENIFSLICNYIEFVFKMIKPRKVFFMAVDGVAPRAKMNQQRGRRFRTAKAALTLEEQAKAMGEQLPTEARFDSNCITPGTPFMVRLQQVLKDFVVHKISSDKLWQNIRVYLSGHETPGEGEHKIMDFIRYEKSQPGYNPNTRHCLYGLDADLIMLGLCSHEPHFSLLREEVKFGGNKKKQKRLVTAEETTFHLLHLSLLRDYLGHEFSAVKQTIKFDFDLEKIIDDFVLMSFLVGNDFIPHLPQLHIHHDALPVLFRTYVEVLPELDGYINEEGNLNLERFQTFLTKLAEYDFKKFGEMSDDFQYLEKKSSKSKKENGSEEKSTADLLTNLGFSNLAVSKTTEFDTSSEEETSDDESMLEMEFNMHKTDYYKNKLEFEEVTPEVLRDQAEGYVRAIQWNLHYYYDGVPSWSWYYPHHYSPFISDLKNFKNMKMKFDLGKPFLPFQQLLSVLPTLSKELLPESYQKLMCDENSPLIDFYPEDFMTDLNGKQQEWEAVVLIPFINERLLVKCSNLADNELSAEESLRNHHGPHFLYTYTEKRLGPLASFLPKYYPALLESHALVQEIHQDFFRLPSHSIVKGLCDGVILDKFLLGFPTLRTLQHTAVLKNEKVKVFQMVSQKENMMLTICESVENDINKLCEKILGKSVYVGWPHLQEALVAAISNGDFNYIFERDRQSRSIRVIEEKMSKDRKQTWERQCETVQENLYQRWGIFVGHINVLVHVRCFSGSKYVISRDNKVVEEKQFEGNTTNFALQTIVSNMLQFSPDVKEEKTAEDIFNVGSEVFVLTSPNYGCKGKIIENIHLKSKGCLLVDIEVTTEPDLLPIIQNEEKLSLEQFMPGYIVAQQLGIDSHFVSRITGTLLIQTSPKVSSNPNRANIGLNLKSNRKNEEVQGFTRRIENQWQYSAEVVTILQAYLEKFADFFERLYQCRNSDVAHIEDLYPEGEGAQVLKDISSWLKEQTCTLADRQTCGIKRLDTGIVAAIEGTTKNVPSAGFHIKMELTPKQLFNPYLCKGVYMPDSKVVFALYDRVTNVSSSSSVPLGFKGTIIGIHTAEKEADSMYEIIFDSEFSTGLPTTTGVKKLYRLPPNCLINLSHGERMKMRVTSPSKTSRPKVNRNAVVENAIQRLNTDKPAQVQILQKRSPAISIQNKPFYKADSVDIFSTRTSDKQFLSGNTAFSPTSPSNAHFIIPKTSPLCNPNENLSQRNASNNVQYERIWNGLKKNGDSPTKQSTSAPKQEYGRKVSVEELFKGLQTHSNQIPKPIIPNSENQNSQNNPKDILHNICKDHMDKTPVYTYHNYGGTNLFVCTITLPTGEEVSSLPCPSQFDAAADASETALAFLHSSALFHSSKTGLQSIQDNPMIQRRPLPPPNTEIVHQFNKFPPGFVARMPHILPPNFPPPPPFGIPPFVRPMEVSVMRNPPPMHTTYIPDSYVKANLMYNEPAIRPPKAASETAETHVFHLGGGATAVIRPDKASPMFVPAQVMKQAVGKTTTEVKLSKTEWPDLLEKDSQLKWPSDVQRKTTPTKSNETSESLKTVSDNLECTKAVKEAESQHKWSSDVQRNTTPFKSNENCESVKTVPDNSECTKAPEWVKPESHLVPLISNNTSKEKLKPTHPPGMTVLKGKRKNRLAANFQNA